LRRRLFVATGCARSPKHIRTANLDPRHRRAAHRGSWRHLRRTWSPAVEQRVEADEPLTPEFVERWCVWPTPREYLDKRLAADVPAARLAAAEAYAQGALRR
jgi:hypothetical protein